MEPIAIVGIDCRFPGSRNKEEFWNLLCNQGDGTSSIPSNRWDNEAFYSEKTEDVTGSMNTRNGGFILDADAFDGDFFGISPREAQAMDPQQRLLLQTSWRAIEDSGVSPVRVRGSNTGVFIGIMGNEWAHLHMTDYQNITPQSGIGNGYCMSANKISYHLDLKGPSLAIDTACSSALVAVHNACNSLRNRECDQALAGGVNLILTPALNIFYTQAGLSSPDGRCKSFSSGADGIARGEGVGILVLKRLEDAIAEKQRIYAVLKGGAINQDGRSNGITAPNRWAQQKVIEQACQRSEVTPDKITFVEGHGTGTILGDLIEVQTLKQIHNVLRDRPCYLGSVKSNVGHLEGAAGIAGLIKAALAIYQRILPATLYCNEPNPHLKLDNNILKLQTETMDLPDSEDIYAGISSFGLGGTNAHLILQSFDSSKPTQANYCSLSGGVFTLSANNPQGLIENIKEQLNYLINNPELNIDTVCHSTNRVKSELPARIAFPCASVKDLIQKMTDYLANLEGEQNGIRLLKTKSQPKVAFLFTGQGSQYSGMAHALYQGNDLFREHLDACDDALQSCLGFSIKKIIFDRNNKELLNQTQFTQPAIFAVQYALAKLWLTMGVTPRVMIGHSVGEYAAACISGVLSLQDAAFLIATRGKLMEALPSDGAMLSVLASEEVFAPWLEKYRDRISVAAYNGKSNLVLAGKEELIWEIQKFCKLQGIRAKRLSVSHAFHSPLMSPILDEFRQKAEEVSYSSPKIPIISSLTGTLVTNEINIDAEYWTNHIARPVKYFQACQNLSKFDLTHVIEIGSKPILINLSQAIHPDATFKWLPSLRTENKDFETLYSSIAELYLDGAKLNWQIIYDNVLSSESIDLPNYKFLTERRYWFELPVKEEKVQPLTKKESLPFISSVLSSQTSEKIDILPSFNKPKKKAPWEIVLALTALVVGYKEEEITFESRFSEDLGYDSMTIMELKNRIEKSFPELGKLPIAELLQNITSVGELAYYIENKLTNNCNYPTAS
jgi:acyl carrier protein